MKDVIAKLREKEQDYLDKAEVIREAIVVLLDGDPGFDVTAKLKDARMPDLVNTGMRLPPSRIPDLDPDPLHEKDGLQKAILRVIRKAGQITVAGITARLIGLYPTSSRHRKPASLRNAIRDIMAVLRIQKPKIKNLKWYKGGRAYTYWFAKSRKRMKP